MSNLRRVLAALYGKPWYTTQENLEAIIEIAQFQAEGGRWTAPEIEARIEAKSTGRGPRGGARVSGSVAIIPIYGTIIPRATLMTAMSGGTSVESIRAAFRDAMADDAVGSILFEVDSPGGYSDGIDELATEIRDARGTKPTAAIANYGMASAAYYIGAQADEVIASPSASVGWIGTYLVHQEESRLLDGLGITTTIFRNPAGKAGGNPYEPLSEKASRDFQQEVDDMTAMFEGAVAKGRGVSEATVRSDFGQGGGMPAKRALKAGLVDRVDTLDNTIVRLAQGRVPFREGKRAESGDVGPITAVDRDGAEFEAGPDGMVELDVPEPAGPQATDRRRELALARARRGRMVTSGPLPAGEPAS